MKRILMIKKIEHNIVKVKIEATKRKWIWLKIDRKNTKHTCTPEKCSLYRFCADPNMKSPLWKYKTFGEFCNNLFIEYPELKEMLTVKSILGVVPIKPIKIKRKP